VQRAKKARKQDRLAGKRDTRSNRRSRKRDTRHNRRSRERAEARSANSTSTSTTSSVESGIDCADFDTQAEAQAWLDERGYDATFDPYDLDLDDDGIPCEELPSGEEEPLDG
jgi:hypothetical protein